MGLQDKKPTAKPSKKSPSQHSSRRCRSASLDTLQKRLVTVLVREVESLMDLSYTTKLSKADSSDLVNYLKLLKDLKHQETTILSSMSDEELEALAKAPTDEQAT
jgi:hypothetical protein